MTRSQLARTTHRAWIWLLRFIAACLMHIGFLPPSLQLVFLEWLREEIDPHHPEMSTVLAEIAELKEMCRA